MANCHKERVKLYSKKLTLIALQHYTQYQQIFTDIVINIKLKLGNLLVKVANAWFNNYIYFTRNKLFNLITYKKRNYFTRQNIYICYLTNS